jgi:tRNA (adenine37-N6)-methyltransferase
MEFTFTPIGRLRTESEDIPRHWSVSDVEGVLEIDPSLEQGLKDTAPDQLIVVIFAFDRSRPFSSGDLVQKPPHKDQSQGVFSICSPVRPNPLGMSVLRVLDVQNSRIRVRGVDMLDNTPILDIKPYIPSKE